MRQRIYNPAQLTPDELKASFIARHETLKRMLRLLAEQKPGHPCQHIVLVGPRGMGKTTLGLSFLQAVREDADLATNWQPVPFPEESYEIGDLADFWLAALRHLAQATGEERWRDRADGLLEDERDTERLATYVLAALLDFCQEQGKRLILFVENLDLVFGQLGNEREVHALREALMEHSEILLVGSANTVFDAIRSYGEPFYEFFRKITLRGLERHECRQLLETLANQEDGNRRSVPLDLEEGRLETIRRLTGGNPRLLVLACRMLLESPLGSAIEDMERLIDEQTPYFKARIEELPPQARKVFHCLAKAWVPLLTREVAADAKLGSSHASAQLRQLIHKGYVREVRLAGEARGRYELSDRFYNIYYLLRFSRNGRARLERLVDFLHQLFGPVGMRHTYEAALDALRNGMFSTADMSDWLTVLAGHVAADQENPGRMSWLSGAKDLVAETLGQYSPLHRELGAIVATEAWDQPDMARVFYAGIMDTMDGDAERAEAAFRDLMATTPGAQNIAKLALGFALYRQGKFAEALEAYRGGETRVRDNKPLDRSLRVLALCGEAFALLRLGETDAAADTLARAPVLGGSGDPERRFPLAQVLWTLGNAFEMQGRKDSAMQAWSRVTELARYDDPEKLANLRRAAIVRLRLTKLEVHNVEDAHAHLQTVADISQPDELPLQRHYQAVALIGTAFTSAESGRPEYATSLLERLPNYIRADDPEDLRRSMVQTLAVSCSTFFFVGHTEAAEMIARHAVRTDPECAQAWSALAEVLLALEDQTHLEEAELCARRAVELAPEDDGGIVTLYAVLKRRRKRKAARELLARVPDADTNITERIVQRWTHTLIAMIAYGRAAQVKQLLIDTNATESLEPLWLAARAELGEDLGPLPAEVLDAVDEVRQMVAEERV